MSTADAKRAAVARYIHDDGFMIGTIDLHSTGWRAITRGGDAATD